MQNWNRKRIGISHKLLSLLASYFGGFKHKKLNILFKNYNAEGQKKEMNFIENFLNLIVFFINHLHQKKRVILDEFENIIFTNSTLGFEAISRKSCCFFC